jgi:hypothetical protein
VEAICKITSKKHKGAKEKHKDKKQGPKRTLGYRTRAEWETKTSPTLPQLTRALGN